MPPVSGSSVTPTIAVLLSAQPPAVASANAAPVAPDEARHRPAVAKSEPLAPVIDFAFIEKSIARKPPGAKGGDPGAEGAFGSGGLGLSGVGEGGGGIGLGSIGAIGHGAGAGSGAGFGSGSGRLSGSHRSKADPIDRALPMRGVMSGEWDDDANYVEFQRYLGGAKEVHALQADVGSRRFLVVRDAQQRPVPNCSVVITGSTPTGAESGKVTLTTMSNGRAIFFPRVELPGAASFIATARCTTMESAPPSQAFDSHAADDVVKLDLGGDRQTDADRTVDVVFVLDTTGSMSEEISAVNATIEKVADVLHKKGLTVRLGLVEYRDRHDSYLARVHPMTRDVAAFVGEIHSVSAGGGGDMPEDVNAGLSVALSELAWSRDSVARMAFLIGDAPPHLDYVGGASYVDSMKRASHDGIQLYTVAASGMDDLGQMVFRQIAMYTGATNLFVLRGGAGPQSVGAGDPKSSCGGTQKIFRTSDLDKLITGKVEQAIAALDADPTKIPGLGADELAKPCRPASP